MMAIGEKTVEGFRLRLIEEEKSAATVAKYTADVRAFIAFLKGEEVTKIKVTEYKSMLVERYAPASVNAAIASLNSFFEFLGMQSMKVKSLKIQRRIFTDREKELTKEEYGKLLCAAERKGDERIYYIMQTICATGIRVSELKYITVEAIARGGARISCKGKMRVVMIPRRLCRALEKYAKSHKIKKGPVFVTKNGKPVDRSNIWNDMKKLCEEARVSWKKVFPHNLRHLFARTYYSVKKDIVRLADILGHSSVNTARIYTMEAGDVHRRQIEQLGLLRC